MSLRPEFTAAPLSPELYEQMRSRFGIPVTGGYGMTGQFFYGNLNSA